MNPDYLMIPAVILAIGTFLLPLLPKRIRSAAFVVFPLIALGAIWTFPEGNFLQVTYAEYELHLLTVDRLSRVFGTIFALIAALGGIYAFHISELGQQVSALAYAAGALGVTFAGDFFTMFFCWEIMAVSSTYLIWARQNPVSDRAGMRYLVVHSIGGGLLLTGILLHLANGGSMLIGELTHEYTMANLFMLVGVSVNAAIPPLHAWIADAYPEATVTGAVFMSAFTTKSAVYVLIRLFPGWSVLLWGGVMMSLYGVIYAIIVTDIRRILAYHIVSQVGYMVAGVGIGTEMAINGATAHAFCHILYKALLFMGAGSVVYATGKDSLTKMGGIAKKMPIVLVLYMIGAFSISGFPLFNGFISKSMVIKAASKAHLNGPTLLLILASVGTFLSVGLKLPYLAWFGDPEEPPNVSAVPFNMKLGMSGAAILCIVLGVYPSLLYDYLPYSVDYHPYTMYHLVETTQILLFTFVGFWVFREKLKGKAKVVLDTDWFYRRPSGLATSVFVVFPSWLFGVVDRAVLRIAERIAKLSTNPLRVFSGREGSTSPVIHADDFTPPLHVVFSLILLTFAAVSCYILW